jgi:hypothetical protein
LFGATYREPLNEFEYVLDETLVKLLEFEAYTMFHALTLNRDGLKYDLYKTAGVFFSFSAPVGHSKPPEEGHCRALNEINEAFHMRVSYGRGICI